MKLVYKVVGKVLSVENGKTRYVLQCRQSMGHRKNWKHSSKLTTFPKKITSLTADCGRKPVICFMEVKQMKRNQLCTDGTQIAEVIMDAMEMMMVEVERPKNRIISECEIIPCTYVNEVWVRSSCDGWCEDVKRLFSYYPDEISFSESEFIGISEETALAKFHARDIAYLRS